MAMRVRSGKVTPVLMDRSYQPADRLTRPDRLFRVVLELLSQADDAARAGDELFLAKRLSEADRVLGYLPPGKLIKSVKHAKERSSALRGGEIPPPPRIGSGTRAPAAKAGVRSMVGQKPKPHKVAKSLQAATKQKRQTVKAAAKRQLAADLLRRSCHDCHVRGSSKVLTLRSGQPRCEKCHEKWARRRCARCGSTWTRKSAADARRRNCPSCRRDQDDFTVSAGAPSLGRRR